MDLRPEQELTTSLVLQQQILNRLEDLGGKVNSFTIKLFGDATVENERGRFPMLERAVEKLQKDVESQISAIDLRVDKLEKTLIRYTAAASVVGAIGSAVVYALFHYFVR